jgi:galactonate dehydratase
MKITDVKTYAVKGRGYPGYPWVFVEVETDEGITGLGEVFAVGFPVGRFDIVESIHRMKKILIGEDPFNVEKLYVQMPLGGVEIALWDIIGKSAGVPIYKLLGGRCRNKIRVYCDGFFRGASYNPEEYSAKAKAAVDQGWTAIKMDLERPSRVQAMECALSLSDVHLTEEIVAAVREAVGPEIDLIIDCHASLYPIDIAMALTLGKKLEPYDLLFFEDPVPPTNVPAMAKVAASTRIPVCADIPGPRYLFRDLFEKQAVQVITGFTTFSGILEMKKIAAMADAYSILMAPHNMCGPVATMANVHLCTCITNFLVMEFQLGGEVPYRDELIDRPVPLENGYLKIPEEPGLGISLNKEAVAKYLVE